MIFVTVGTHEQSFNRLIEKIDELVANGNIKEKVIMQIGYSTYTPKYCEYYKMLSYDNMQKYLKEARIVITHGGPSSFIEALQFGKVPIVVPRQEKYHEHVNDHQVDFVKLIAKRMNNIIPVYNTDDLLTAINNYNQLVKNKNSGESSNNRHFNEQLNQIVDRII